MRRPWGAATADGVTARSGPRAQAPRAGRIGGVSRTRRRAGRHGPASLVRPVRALRTRPKMRRHALPTPPGRATPRRGGGPGSGLGPAGRPSRGAAAVGHHPAVTRLRPHTAPLCRIGTQHYHGGPGPACHGSAPHRRAARGGLAEGSRAQRVAAALVVTRARRATGPPRPARCGDHSALRTLSSPLGTLPGAPDPPTGRRGARRSLGDSHAHKLRCIVRARGPSRRSRPAATCRCERQRRGTGGRGARGTEGGNRLGARRPATPSGRPATPAGAGRPGRGAERASEPCPR